MPFWWLFMWKLWIWKSKALSIRRRNILFCDWVDVIQFPRRNCHLQKILSRLFTHKPPETLCLDHKKWMKVISKHEAVTRREFSMKSKKNRKENSPLDSWHKKVYGLWDENIFVATSEKTRLALADIPPWLMPEIKTNT